MDQRSTNAGLINASLNRLRALGRGATRPYGWDQAGRNLIPVVSKRNFLKTQDAKDLQQFRLFRTLEKRVKKEEGGNLKKKKNRYKNGGRGGD